MKDSTSTVAGICDNTMAFH